MVTWGTGDGGGLDYDSFSVSLCVCLSVCLSLCLFSLELSRYLPFLRSPLSWCALPGEGSDEAKRRERAQHHRKTMQDNALIRLRPSEVKRLR